MLFTNYLSSELWLSSGSSGPSFGLPKEGGFSMKTDDLCLGKQTKSGVYTVYVVTPLLLLIIFPVACLQVISVCLGKKPVNSQFPLLGDLRMRQLNPEQSNQFPSIVSKRHSPRILNTI